MERPKTDETLCFVCQKQPITHIATKEEVEQFGLCEICADVVIEESNRMNAMKKAIQYADKRKIFTYILGGDLDPVKIQVRRING